MPSIAFLDLETTADSLKILDTGAVTSDGKHFHHPSAYKLLEFLRAYDFVAGHNIVAHDLPALQKN